MENYKALKSYLLLALLLLGGGPAFAYEEDTHFQLTYVMLRCAGFTAEEALTVAAADQGMDDSPNTVANHGLVPEVDCEWKFHAFSNAQFTKDVSAIMLNKEVIFGYASGDSNYVPPLVNQGISTYSRLVYFGVFLHYQQDSWAHRYHVDGLHFYTTSHLTYDAWTPFTTPYGHASQFHQPDRPPFCPICTIKCMEDGMRYAKIFLERVLDRPIQPQFDVPFLFVEPVFNPRTDGKYGPFFHPLSTDGIDRNTAQGWFTYLINTQVANYTSTPDPTFGEHVTANAADLVLMREAFNGYCSAYGPAFGLDITVPTTDQKLAQGFSNMDSARVWRPMWNY